jgi:nucleotide-binding universal stress UspA family protein
MIKHIVVAVDFGEPSRAAQSYGVELAQKLGAKLTLLHVYGIPTVYYPDTVSWPLEDLGKAAQASLEAEVATVRVQVPNAEGRIEVGDPRERILLFAKESGADLLIVGTHGRRGIAHLVLGSVAEWVVRMSPVPVLTVQVKGK